MTTDHDRELQRLAEAVSDSTSVDWDDESGAHPALDPAIQGLRKVEAVASAFRRASVGASENTGRAVRSWGHLEVLELVGEGSFGVVYRAHDPLLDRGVALKLRREGSSNRQFIEEGRRLARVRHPNVLTVHGVDVHDDQVGMWTELVDGRTLREIVADQGPMDSNEAVAIGIDLSRALAAVHEGGLIHGDVKASNVFRETGGRIVLGDFGSASELDSTGRLSGSPVSVAPERFAGAAAAPASDIYSLGVLIYFLLSGHYPVEGDDLATILERHKTDGSVPLDERRPEIPAEVADIVHRATATDPGQRFASAADLEGALTAVIDGPTEPHPAREGDFPPDKRWRPRKWLVAFAVVAVVVGLAGWRAISLRTSAPLVTEATLLLDTPDGPIALQDGASIAPGDRLYLEFELSAPGHVYVANEDEAGEVFTLFPIPGLDLENPLPEGRIRLPGAIDGEVNDWRVTSAGGTETFLVVASPEPVAEIESHFASWTAASASRPVSSSSETEALVRGVGALSAAPLSNGDGNRLAELQRRLSELEGRGRLFWSRRFVLQSGSNRSQ